MAGPKNVDAAGAQALLSDGAVYLDVRTPEEFAAGHAPSSVNVPLAFAGPGGMAPNPDFVQQVEAAFPAKDARLVVGCKAGNRSTRALAALTGYTDLAHNAGGWDAWVAAGLPVEK